MGVLIMPPMGPVCTEPICQDDLKTSSFKAAQIMVGNLGNTQNQGSSRSHHEEGRLRTRIEGFLLPAHFGATAEGPTAWAPTVTRGQLALPYP